MENTSYLEDDDIEYKYLQTKYNPGKLHDSRRVDLVVTRINPKDCSKHQVMLVRTKNEL